jgi:hypothetical protein
MIPLGLTFRRGGQASLLCGLATLRAKYFLFTLAKAQAEPQRNCSPPLVCHGGFLPVCLPEAFAALRANYFYLLSQRRRAAKKLWFARFDFRRPLRLGVFARHILFFFFIIAKVQRNCGLLGLNSVGREPARKCRSCSNKLHVAKLVILYTFLE